jgi:RNAse (barnase) inhibitor barstar
LGIVLGDPFLKILWHVLAVEIAIPLEVVVIYANQGNPEMLDGLHHQA